ncbi:SGNH/GDSL hydrolase family protein [Longispora albida]|uniref:SGNH/GDSL hydrolase family protein n=1 Tax=Longispora albida TaxID=203523 RepID=UPI00035F2F9D|nr:SGNH/GDSL hydrolase family protein [Longispora albida]
MTTVESEDQYCLSAGEIQSLLSGHPWRHFLVLGDSVAEGLGDPLPGYDPAPWADRLASALQAEYLNLGKHGLRSAEVRATQLDAGLAFAPDLAVVVCGGNDAFRRDYDPAAVDAELEAMVIALQATGCDVLTVGMFDISYCTKVPEWLRPGLRDRMATLAKHTRTLSHRLGTLHVHLTDHPLSTDPAIYSADGLHGNARSHAVAATEAIKVLGAHLAAQH